MGKVYAVKEGKTRGIFHTWDECKASVSGYSGAKYKSFKTEDEANIWLGNVVLPSGVSSSKFTGYEEFDECHPELGQDGAVAYVDGSFNANKGYYGCGVVLMTNNKKIEIAGCDSIAYLAKMRNISGELLGAMVAIKKAYELGKNRLTIYHDLEGTGKWANHLFKRNETGTIQYDEFVSNAREYMAIDFVWVQAHSGIKYNERADKLASTGIKEEVKIDSSKYFGGSIFD